MAQINVSVPSQLKDWVDSRVAEGRYSSASDFVRDLLRRDLDNAKSETQWLQGLIQEGLESGIAKGNSKDVIERVVAKRRDRRG